MSRAGLSPHTAGRRTRRKGEICPSQTSPTGVGVGEAGGRLEERAGLWIFRSAAAPKSQRTDEFVMKTMLSIIDVHLLGGEGWGGGLQWGNDRLVVREKKGVGTRRSDGRGSPRGPELDRT